MKILYIEDSREHIQTVQRITRYLRHDLLTAETAKSGYALLAQQPDLILLDITLPDINGLDLARRLRSEGVTVPIIALTANAVEYDEAQARAAGCDEFLVKPYSAEQFMALLARFAPLES